MLNTDRLLELALKGLEADRARLDREIAEIKSQFSSASRSGGTASHLSAPAKRRTMSAAARKKISEGMKRRYAEMRRSARGPDQPKRSQSSGLTAAGRKKLSDMMKARWAAKKRAGKKAA